MYLLEAAILSLCKHYLSCSIGAKDLAVNIERPVVQISY